MVQKIFQTKSTYLNEFLDFKKRKIAYLSLGTIEWHGRHLPLETDFMVAEKIVEVISKKIPGFVLPPLYLGTDRKVIRRGVVLRGMDRHLGKVLPGSIYYLEPNVLFSVINSVVKNCIQQGLKKVILIAGHTGSLQVKVLKRVEKLNHKNTIFINPFKGLNVHIEHADEYETSLLWACYPEEQTKSLKMKISADDDYIQSKGYDPRRKASIKTGKKIFKEILSYTERQIRKKL